MLPWIAGERDRIMHFGLYNVNNKKLEYRASRLSYQLYWKRQDFPSGAGQAQICYTIIADENC